MTDRDAIALFDAINDYVELLGGNVGFKPEIQEKRRELIKRIETVVDQQCERARRETT